MPEVLKVMSYCMREQEQVKVDSELSEEFKAQVWILSCQRSLWLKWGF